MKKVSKFIEMELSKEEILTKLEALEVYRAIKNANPKLKQDIKKLRNELVSGLSRHDRKSGIWFANIYKKVLEVRSKNISLESLEIAYNTKDKELIARKLTAHYCNYGISVGAVLGSAGGVLGFLTAAYATFGEMACLTYFQLCLIYDLSVLYERPLDKANKLEIYKLLKIAFGISDKDFLSNKLDDMTDKGTRLIEEKLLKGDSQKLLYGLLKNIGAAVIHKSVRNLIAKVIPLIGAISGILICTTLDYESVKSLSKKTLGFYNNTTI
jgi:uncharacterized protein (DUF697 family)